MPLRFSSLIAATAFAFAPVGAHAAVTTYTSEAAFMAAVSGATTIAFEAENPAGPNGYTYAVSPLAIGDVSFAQADSRLFVFGQSFYPTYGLTSSYLTPNSQAPAGIDVSFAAPVYAVGMNLGIQNTWDDPSLEVTFSLSTGDVVTTPAPMLWDTSNGMAYFGFTSTVAITSFNVNGPSGGVAIDNFSSALVVPEPEAYLLALIGSGGVLLLVRRRRVAAGQNLYEAVM